MRDRVGGRRGRRAGRVAVRRPLAELQPQLQRRQRLPQLVVQLVRQETALFLLGRLQAAIELAQALVGDAQVAFVGGPIGGGHRARREIGQRRRVALRVGAEGRAPLHVFVADDADDAIAVADGRVEQRLHAVFVQVTAELPRARVVARVLDGQAARLAQRGEIRRARPPP